MLKELDIAKDFEKDVRVPTVSNLRELQTVLQSSSGVPAGSIEQALARIHEHAGGDHVGIGIKPIIAFISEARMNQDSAAFADKFSNLVLTKMQGSWAR